MGSGRTTWFETEGTSYEWKHGESYGGKKVGQDMMSNARGWGLGLADQALVGDFELFHGSGGRTWFNMLTADLKPRAGGGED